ncbi:hypothetical protein V5799_016480 [Amblyomma americanum]|uniref:Uncharacterized protein n=1 Tax=Amblyomma americanum TaxID=6943 RepID=A0AAQ4F6A1_AMBAM
MLCLVLAYSVPWSNDRAIGGVGGLARSLPWGVIITVAGSGAISLVVKLLNGFAVKVMALIMILLTVNLNSDLHRLPDWMFSENQNYTAAFSY